MLLSFVDGLDFYATMILDLPQLNDFESWKCRNRSLAIRNLYQMGDIDPNAPETPT